MAGCHVLVIDDDPNLVQMIELALQQVGYRVCFALGQQAIQLAIREQPALILLDLGLPALDGREIAQRLRADPRTCATPIVTISGHDPFGALAGAIGGNDHLRKPFTIQALQELVARWVPCA